MFIANAEGDEEMDIDHSAGNVADASAYIGDNCLSTPVSFVQRLIHFELL